MLSREAGLQPNQLTTAYDEDALLDRYAMLVRELGRIPVSGDLRLKAQQEKGFPSHNTFKRLGTKADAIKKLLVYCHTHANFEDVSQICQAYPQPEPSVTDGRDSGDEVGFGFVYLIRSGRYFKIGKTNSAGRRERELAIQLPEKANTVHVIRTDDPTGIEE
jgi:hypothetical protein